MKPFESRKSPHFFIINPLSDRRMEIRFESRCDVTVEIETTKENIKATAFDIGQRGLRLQTKKQVAIDTPLQVEFHDNAENIRCFGRVMWSRPTEEGNNFNSGVSIDSWQGIVQGTQSWKKYKGFKLKPNRRRDPR